MHKVWLDTNILIDYFLKRIGFEKPAIELLKKIECKEIEGSTSIINLIHCHYQLRKYTSEITTKAMLSSFISIVKIMEIPTHIADNALLNPNFNDFEDAVQFELALFSKANFLLTRNLKDFPSSSLITVCTAESYLIDHHLSNA